ncbi:MAG: FecR domain-containing protein, partial [Hyphomicrobiales bacterium]|nr:FecR domain-containing protein [Hyphomicrobiales bacterium]
FKDRCRSGEGARLQATLKDGTHLTLGEHATLVVDEFVYNPVTSHGELAVRIAKGAFLYVGGLIEGEPGAKVRIRTPAAAIGVRGTTVWGGPIDKGFGVLALSGEVTVTGRRGTVALKQGEGTMLFADGKPRRVVQWPTDKVKRALATISFGNRPGGQ